MSTEENRQIIIKLPTANGESQAILISPEILPEQLFPLFNKKSFKDEKSDNGLQSSYKKLIESLNENRIVPITSVSSLASLLDVSQSTKPEGDINTGESLITNNSSSSNPPANLIITRSGTDSAVLLQPSSSGINADPGSLLSDSSSNYLTALQISQAGNASIPTLTFSQPQNLIQYTNPNQNSNTVLIPISLQNNQQYSQQFLVAAAAVATGNSQSGMQHQQTLPQVASSTDCTTMSPSLSKLISDNLNPQGILTSIATTTTASTGSYSHKYDTIRSSAPTINIATVDPGAPTKMKTSSHSNTDEFGKRKEMRLLKNREAARECRRKKKEYVKCLESRVANLEKQNKVLVDEINRMKELYPKRGQRQSPSGSSIAKTQVGTVMSSMADNDNMYNSLDAMETENLGYLDSHTALSGLESVSDDNNNTNQCDSSGSSNSGSSMKPDDSNIDHTDNIPSSRL